MAQTTLSIISPPSSGVLSNFNAGTGAVTYTPNFNFYGQDSFTYAILCDDAPIDTATVHITVNYPVGTLDIVNENGSAAATSLICGNTYVYKASLSFDPAVIVTPISYLWSLPSGITSPDLTLSTIPIVLANPLAGPKTLQLTVTTPYEVLVKTLLVNVSCANAFDDTVATSANTPIMFILSSNDITCN